jgi:hypothetical protein
MKVTLAPARKCRCGLGLTDGQIQLGGDLFIGKVQTHQVQARHPGAQGPMMAFKDSAAHIIKLGATSQTLVPLAIALPVMMSTPENLFGATLRAVDAFGPAQVTDDLVTFRFINQLFKVDNANRVLSRFYLGEGGFHHLLEIGKEPLYFG